MNIEMEAATGGHEKWKAQPLAMPQAPRELKLRRSHWRWRMRWHRLTHWQGWRPLLIALQLPVLLGLFLFSGPLLRLVDPTSASLDAGVVSVLLVTVLIVDTFVVSACLLVRLLRSILPGKNEWDEEEEDEFFKEKLEPCLEAKIMIGSFWGLVLLFVVVFIVLL